MSSTRDVPSQSTAAAAVGVAVSPTFASPDGRGARTQQERDALLGGASVLAFVRDHPADRDGLSAAELVLEDLANKLGGRVSEIGSTLLDARAVVLQVIADGASPSELAVIASFVETFRLRADGFGPVIGAPDLPQASVDAAEVLAQAAIEEQARAEVAELLETAAQGLEAAAEVVTDAAAAAGKGLVVAVLLAIALYAALSRGA